MKLSDCPKFRTCSAPICILDDEWTKRVHQKDDPCCFYLLESQKDGAEAIFRGAGRERLYVIAIAVASEIMERHAPLRKSIERCKTTGSRMNRFGGSNGEK